MSNITPTKNRKKVVALALTGGLLSLTLVGGTFAALSATISTEAGTESLNSTLSYLYKWTVASEPIVADITPVTSPVAQVFTKGVDNNSSVDSNFAVWVSGVNVADIPDSLLDETNVRVTVADGTTTKVATMPLRQFLTTALVFTENDEAITLAAHTNLNITVEVTAPDNTGTADFSDALDFTSEGFITNVTFNQKINGTSDLWDYANTPGNSTWGDENVMGVSLSGGAFTF